MSWSFSHWQRNHFISSDETFLTPRSARRTCSLRSPHSFAPLAALVRSPSFISSTTSSTYDPSAILERGRARSLSRHHYVSTRHPPSQPSLPPPPSQQPIRRRLLLRSFGLIDSHRRGYITSKSLTNFAKFMGVTISPNMLFPYSSHDVSTDELTLEQAQFVSFAGEHLGHIGNESYVECLEGYLEAQLVSKHKVSKARQCWWGLWWFKLILSATPLVTLQAETLLTIFNNHILPNFFHLPTNSSTPPPLPLVPALLKVLSGTVEPSPTPVLHQLTFLYPDSSLMWCRFLSFFACQSKNLDDKVFTEKVRVAVSGAL